VANAEVRRVFIRGTSLLLVLFLAMFSTAFAEEHNGEFFVPEYDLLALDAEIKDLLDREVRPLGTKKQRLLQLHEIFYQPYYYDIQYEPFGTLTANETFYRGSGNCISLANLFIAAARYVGLDARYQTVRVRREWRPREGFYEVPGHINVVVNLRREQAEIEFNRTFYDERRNRRIVKKVISDRQAKAEFYNNIGVDLLVQKQYDKAIAYFEKALTIYKKLDFVYSNLGVAFKQKGNYQSAEANYLKALDYNPKSQSTISNIFILYHELGNKTRSEVYAKRAEKYARKNPYYLEKLANAHIQKGEYSNAIKLLKNAIRIFDLEPNFYHDLAVAYYYQNNIAKSKRALEKAKALSKSEEFKARYQRKLDALAAVN